MRKALLKIRLFMCFAISIATIPCAAQDLKIIRETVASAGGSYALRSNNEHYQVQQSIGQGSVIGLYQANALQIRQGFIQPNGLYIGDENVEPVTWKVYPNPFREAINITTEHTVVGLVTVVLSDLSGREVLSWHLEGLSSQRLDCAELPIGSYLLSIRSHSSIQTIQLIRL